LDVNALLEGDLSILIDEDLLDVGQLFSEVNSKARADLTVAQDEPLEGLKEWRQVEVGRLLISFLLLVKPSLSLQFLKSGTSLLGLLLLCECAFLSGSQSVSGVLTPVGEVAIPLHVPLREAEDFEGLEQKVSLCQHVANQLMIVSWVVEEVV
jgi:hypothetical protein